MSVGAPVAADIPGIYDLIIGQLGGTAHGYMLARQIDPNIPFRTQRGRYGFSPTFIERANVNGDFGDNQQDFWLTATQRDWSLGEGQKFFRSADADKVRQFWSGTNVDIATPGALGSHPDKLAKTFASALAGAIAVPTSGLVYTCSATNLVSIDGSGTVTDLGAHGVGAQPTAFATDGKFLYLSATAGTKVRKYDIAGAAFSDFSATTADALLYLNNTLYGTNANVLNTYDTAGTATASFTFKTATGAALGGTMQLIGLGGRVEILRTDASTNGSELWDYDGTGVAKLCEFPGNFNAQSFCVVDGIIFIIGQERKTSTYKRIAIWYFANGNIGRAYAEPSFRATRVGGIGIAQVTSAITPYGEGLLFNVQGLIKFYDVATGAVSSVATTSYTLTGNAQIYMATSSTFAVAIDAAVTTNNIQVLFDPSTSGALTNPPTAVLQTSVFDFESSLTKLFRGITVDFVGSGVDIAYQLDDAGGTYTSLATGVSSGVETLFPSSITGRGISVQVTINNGGATLKRVYVRAAPKLQSFRMADYIVDATGADGKTPVQLRNGMDHPLDGAAMATNLRTDMTSGNLLTIIDRFGSFTGVVEVGTVDIVEVAPNEYYVRFSVREV